MKNLILFMTFQAIVIQTAYSQCVNRVISNCAPNVVETILPNQYFGPQLAPALGPLAPALAPAPVLAPPLVPGVISEVGYPTVIQDSSVANNLANALQLLVVSNLLSSTLPGPCELPLPGYPVESMVPMPSLPAYNYVY
ncbi:uncharacterized protein LOC123715357 [Pieris brassicae]|uniref:Uncharacterized protein n=1 Tax=Pieris brassicae TaxID=7116 RepID=A0A9P0TPM2_PIEBR|nr:uncharacterized protein LOC123715357 [Pieris brassicae]CAH4032646.1 unnamed protein product [Pieris brassicae]